MKKKLCTLVLGVGGNVGQGILKALRLGTLPLRVISACVAPLSMGLYTTERSFISPYYDDPRFLPWLCEVCEQEKVDVILTGVEPLLYCLASHEQFILEQTGAKIISASKAHLEMAQDKWATGVFLKENGLHCPRFALATEEWARSFSPADFGKWIAKPRYGRGGAGIFHIKDEATLHYVIRQKDYLVQEYIGSPQSEYTIGSFCDAEGVLCGMMVMRRELLEGTTYRAELGLFPEVRAEAERIVQAIRPKGPCNLQMRVSDEGVPTCFEINMRFSGTTPLKAQFGFNEVQAALELFILGHAQVQLHGATSGVALRYWNEVYIDPAAYRELHVTGQLKGPQQFGLTIETYGQL